MSLTLSAPHFCARPQKNANICIDDMKNRLFCNAGGRAFTEITSGGGVAEAAFKGAIFRT